MPQNIFLYINVAGKGTDTSNAVNKISSGGYNGGGYGQIYNSDEFGAGGGGATHIAVVSGQLKSLEKYRGILVDNSYYISEKILIVAGGGSGAADRTYTTNNGKNGVSGGGYIGNYGLVNPGSYTVYPGTQTTAGYQDTTPNPSASYKISGLGGFGYGGNSRDAHNVGSGGGGGWYGGGGTWRTHDSAAGGSGYIASSSLISGGGVTKHMSGYNISTSSATETLTYSNTTTPSATATADVAKLNNGYARITYLGPSI